MDYSYLENKLNKYNIEMLEKYLKTPDVLEAINNSDFEYVYDYGMDGVCEKYPGTGPFAPKLTTLFLLENVPFLDYMDITPCLAFEGLYLKELTIPESIKILGLSSFKNARIEKLTIPESVIGICLDSFEQFKGTIYYKGTVDQGENIEAYSGQNLNNGYHLKPVSRGKPLDLYIRDDDIRIFNLCRFTVECSNGSILYGKR